MADNYYNLPQWSYSSMKKILDSGIDYAVAAKQGLLGEPSSSAIDLGQLAHMLILGGEDNFALCEYPDFRTKEARAWRDLQIAAGKNIITKSQFEAVSQMVHNVENHPLARAFLLGDNFRHEVELFANTPEGVELKGKADALKVTSDNALIITDVKTTAQFDKFKQTASWRHYDLQTAVYTLISSASMNISSSLTNYYYCVVETVMPYRVQFFHASAEFVEAGERKLRYCIDEIAKFGDRLPNFLIKELGELGDYSL